jgi:hypothetical protein
VREASCERRAVVESVGFATFGELNLSFEGFDFFPSLQDRFLLLREIYRHLAMQMAGVVATDEWNLRKYFGSLSLWLTRR